MPLFILLLLFVAAAAALVWFLVSHDHGQKEPVVMLWVAAGMGLLGAVGAVILERIFLNSDSLLPGTPHGALLLTALSVGVIEEACKFVPLAVLLYNKRYFNEHTDGVIYFALAGLGFGLPENLLYTSQLGTQVGVARLLLIPLFHAATTGIAGYYLSKRKLAGKSAWGVIVPLAAMMLLHGLYNFGLAAGTATYAAMSLLIALGTAATLFLLFMRATDYDQDRGLSVVGHNAFCRSCGWANPKHRLYCTHCGKNA